jgi:hypothetical protein
MSNVNDRKLLERVLMILHSSPVECAAENGTLTGVKGYDDLVGLQIDVAALRWPQPEPLLAEASEPDHVMSLTTEDRNGFTISPTCAYCGRAEEFCGGSKP